LYEEQLPPFVVAIESNWQRSLHVSSLLRT
jgi:hypothetical protein